MSGPRMRLRTRLAAIAGVVVFLVLAGTGASYAAWTASSAVTATATSTGAALTMGSLGGLTTTYTSSSTGPVIASVAIANTGGAPLALATSTTTSNAALSGQIALRYWVRVGASCGTTIPGTGVAVGTLAAPPALPSGATSLAAGGTLTLCVATTFTGTYASYAGQSTAVTLTLTGTVGTSWTATATGSFTQTLQAASTPSFQCVNSGGGPQVTISWANTPTANSGTLYESRVNGTIQSGLNRDYWYRTYSNMGHAGTGLPAVAGFYTWEILETTNGVQDVAYSGQIEVFFHAPWNAWGIRCA